MMYGGSAGLAAGPEAHETRSRFLQASFPTMRTAAAGRDADEPNHHEVTLACAQQFGARTSG